MVENRPILSINCRCEEWRGYMGGYMGGAPSVVQKHSPWWRFWLRPRKLSTFNHTRQSIWPVMNALHESAEKSVGLVHLQTPSGDRYTPYPASASVPARGILDRNGPETEVGVGEVVWRLKYWEVVICQCQGCGWCNHVWWFDVIFSYLLVFDVDSQKVLCDDNLAKSF